MKIQIYEYLYNVTIFKIINSTKYKSIQVFQTFYNERFFMYHFLPIYNNLIKKLIVLIPVRHVYLNN